MEPAQRLVRELVDLRRARASRILDVRLADATVALFIRDGELTGVDDARPRVPIGRILVRRNLVTRERYIDVLHRLNDAKRAGQPARFGELAVGLGYVSAEDATECLIEQVRWPALRFFFRVVSESAPLTWTARALAPASAEERAHETPLSIEALLFAALRRCGAARCVEVAGAAAHTSALAAEWDVAEIDERFELGDAEGHFVREALAGARTALDLGEKERPASVDVEAVVAALLVTGAAASRPPGPARSVPPPIPRGPRPPPTWALIDATTAKDIAVRAVAARGADAGGPLAEMVKGEESFERGRDLFRRGDVKRALPMLEAALPVVGTDECELLVRWSRLWMAQKGLTVEAGSELEARARAVLADDPDLAFAHFVLGDALQAQGRMDDARRHLMHSIRLDKDVLEGIRDRRLATMRGSPGRRTSEGQLGVSIRGLDAMPVFPKSDPAILVGVPAARSPALRDPARAGIMAPQVEPTIEEIDPVAAPDPGAQGRPKPLPIVAGVLGIIALGAILGVAAAGWDFAPAPAPAPSSIRRMSELSAAVPARAIPSAPPPASAVAPDASSATASPSASSAPPAPPTDVAARLDAGSAIDPTKGRLRLPSNALGHRIFVDGRVAASDVDQLVVTCGRHDVRIGSRGSTHSVDVPCGAELDVRAEKGW